MSGSSPDCDFMMLRSLWSCSQLYPWAQQRACHRVGPAGFLLDTVRKVHTHSVATALWSPAPYYWVPWNLSPPSLPSSIKSFVKLQRGTFAPRKACSEIIFFSLLRLKVYFTYKVEYQSCHSRKSQGREQVGEWNGFSRMSGKPVGKGDEIVVGRSWTPEQDGWGLHPSSASYLCDFGWGA